MVTSHWLAASTSSSVLRAIESWLSGGDRRQEGSGTLGSVSPHGPLITGPSPEGTQSHCCSKGRETKPHGFWDLLPELLPCSTAVVQPGHTGAAAEDVGILRCVPACP